VEGLVQTKTWIDVAWKFVGLGDDRLERRPNESVAVRLATGQSACIAAKKRQMGGKFLSKGHGWVFSLVFFQICAVFTRRL
jgi:hypothetical protein